MKFNGFINSSGRNDSSIKIFCFPYAGGNSTFYRLWEKEFSGIAEIVSIELPGRNHRLFEPPYKYMDTLIEDLIEEIVPVMGQRNIFVGYSMGAKIAFELLRCLTQRDIELPDHFIAIASPAPHMPRKKPDIHTLSDRELIDSLATYGGMSPVVLQDKDLLDLLLPTIRADFSLLETYCFLPIDQLDTKLSVFGGLNDVHVTKDEVEQWSRHFSHTEKSGFFPGGHFFINDNFKSLIHEIKNICESINIEEKGIA